MKRHRNIVILIIFVIPLFILWFLFSPRPGVYRAPPDPTERITHTYRISENKMIIVDTWDCGATCRFNTWVYIKDVDSKFFNRKTLIDCEHMSDITLTDVTASSARIASIGGDEPACGYRTGDILRY